MHSLSPETDNCPSWIRRRERPYKIFHDQSQWKNVHEPAWVKPGTSWSPIGWASNWPTKASLKDKYMVHNEPFYLDLSKLLSVPNFVTIQFLPFCFWILSYMRSQLQIRWNHSNEYPLGMFSVRNKKKYQHLTLVMLNKLRCHAHL